MAAYLSDPGGNALLNIELGGAAASVPGTWYVGLSLAPANKFGTLFDPLAHGAEVTGAGYARVAVVNNTTNFPATSGGVKTNGTAIVFPVPTAAWGTVLSVFFADAATNGNVWRSIDISPVTINSGAAAPTIAIGALSFTHS